MKKIKFFKCNHCGNVVIKLLDKSVPIFCCGEKMEEISANTMEASQEKHLPVVSFDNCMLDVKVGEVSHPMEAMHYINFIVVETNNGFSIVSLLPGKSPQAKIYIGKNKVVAVYEYCNLHGLWKTEIK